MTSSQKNELMTHYINAVMGASAKESGLDFLSNTAYKAAIKDLPTCLIDCKYKGDNIMDANDIKSVELKRSSDFTKKLYENIHKNDNKVEKYKFTMNSDTKEVENIKHNISTTPYFYSMGEAIGTLINMGYVESTAEILVLNRKASLARINSMIDDIKELLKNVIPDGNQDDLDYNSESKVCGKMTMKDINKQYNKMLITKFILTYTE